MSRSPTANVARRVRAVGSVRGFSSIRNDDGGTSPEERHRRLVGRSVSDVVHMMLIQKSVCHVN